MRRLLAVALGFMVCPTAAQAQIVEYYHLDGVGNVLAVTDSAGTVVEQHDYLPFGEEWCGTAICGAVTAGQPKRFTGKERDAETGLDYFGARYYSSRIGRFTTTDPVLDAKGALFNPQKWNRYAYGLNNPFRYVDPDGRQAAPGQFYVIGQGWTNRSTLDPANRPTPQMAMQFMAVTAGIGLAAAAPALVVEAQIAAATCGSSAGCQNAIRGMLESASGAPPGAMGSLPFQSGDIITREFKTAKGVVEMAAEAVVEGKSLHLKDIAVFPRGAERLEVGAAEVMAMRRQLAEEARGLGFEQLRVTGTRISGANPGRAVDVTIDLTKKQ
jgi:RHS repeat-associated protein